MSTRLTRRIGLLLTLLLTTAIFGLAFSSSNEVVDAQTGTWTATVYSDTNFGTSIGTVSYSSAQLQSLSFGAGGPPVTNAPSDNFSIRFTSQQVFNTGSYQIRLIADDRATLTINGQQIAVVTGPNQPVTVNYQVQLSSTLNLQLDYVEFTDQAFLQLQITLGGAVGPTFTPAPTATATRTPLPPIPPGAITATVIRAGVLNVRDAPSLGGNRIGRILRGETYAVVGRDSDARWFLLQLGGYQGWSWGFYLFIDGNEFNPPVVSGNSILGLAGQPDFGVRGQSEATLRLRQGPSVATAQIGRVTWGAFLPIVGRTADGFWYKTVWKNTVGWVYSPFIEIREGDLNNVPITNQ